MRGAELVSRWASALIAPVGAVRALGVYLLAIMPRVRVGLDAWERVACAIPDPVLRMQALDALRRKASNVEAAAVFATLAPRARRAEVVTLLVALQVLIDYLDTVSEEAVRDPLSNSMALHGALVDAVEDGPANAGYYRHHPRREDGGYLASLVERCQAGCRALPAMTTVRPIATRAARRCGAGQSYTHGAIHGGGAGLAAWTARLATGTGYRWWEVAAGASSSVAVHAVVAAAADPRTTRTEAERIDTTYYLAVGSLTVLLDNLVDRERDLRAGGHNYLAYYADVSDAAGRIAAIAANARACARGLRRRRRHEAIVAGVLGFYLSAPEAHAPYADAIRSELLERADPAARLILRAMRVRRRLRA